MKQLRGKWRNHGRWLASHSVVLVARVAACGAEVAWTARRHSCLTTLGVCQPFLRNSVLETFPHCVCCTDVPQQEQDKGVTVIHLHSISIDIFRALIGITFKMLLYDE